MAGTTDVTGSAALPARDGSSGKGRMAVWLMVSGRGSLQANTGRGRRRLQAGKRKDPEAEAIRVGFGL